jgi:hypothetical protein
MPVTYIIDPARRLIRTTCSGPVTLADVIDHFRTLNDDPACSGQLDVLLDVSGADAVPESSELRVVNSEIAAIRRKVQFGMCVIVAKSDPMFGMMRVFGVFAEQAFRVFQVFREAAEAEAWLVSQAKAEDHPRDLR